MSTKGKASKTQITLPIGDGMSVSLTNAQLDFCHHIARGATPTQARLDAGYKDYTVGAKDLVMARQHNTSAAYQLMHSKADIAIYANYLQQQRREKLSLTIEDLLKTTAAIIHFDPAMLFDSAGAPIENIWDIPYTARMAIKELKTNSYIDPQGNTVVQNEYKFYSKIDAMNMLTRLQELAGTKMKAKLSGKTVKLQRT